MESNSVKSLPLSSCHEPTLLKMLTLVSVEGASITVSTHSVLDRYSSQRISGRNWMSSDPTITFAPSIS